MRIRINEKECTANNNNDNINTTYPIVRRNATIPLPSHTLLLFTPSLFFLLMFLILTSFWKNSLTHIVCDSPHALPWQVKRCFEISRSLCLHSYSLSYRTPTTNMWLTAAHTFSSIIHPYSGAPWSCSCCTCQRPLLHVGNHRMPVPIAEAQGQRRMVQGANHGTWIKHDDCGLIDGL